MSGQWDVARSAVATKIAASAGCAAAGLRKADTDSDAPLVPPHLRVLQVSAFEMTGRPNAYQEQYRLTIVAELVVPKPAGKRRAEPTVATIARAVQVEFQTGITIGQSSYVTECVLAAWSEGLQEYAHTDMDGGRFTFLLDVIETLATARTA